MSQVEEYKDGKKYFGWGYQILPEITCLSWKEKKKTSPLNLFWGDFRNRCIWGGGMTLSALLKCVSIVGNTSVRAVVTCGHIS